MSVDNIQGIQDVLTPESYLGMGMGWPPREDPATGDLQRAQGEVSVSECLVHLLTTVLGELAHMVTFGTRIDELIGSQGDDTFVQDVMAQMRRAIAANERRITVLSLTYKIRLVTSSNRAVEMQLVYRIVETGKVVTQIFELPQVGT